MNQRNIFWEEKKHTENQILNADWVVKSPGIPENISIVKKIKKADIPIISEIEFADFFNTKKVIGITGSNGKTTTTLLTHHILKNQFVTGLAGNIGLSFARQVSEDKNEIYTLELSSFQLDGVLNFRPDIAVITNITPDHLDRYENDFQKYIDAKFRITQKPNRKRFFNL